MTSVQDYLRELRAARKPLGGNQYTNGGSSKDSTAPGQGRPPVKPPSPWLKSAAVKTADKGHGEPAAGANTSAPQTPQKRNAALSLQNIGKTLLGSSAEQGASPQLPTRSGLTAPVKPTAHTRVVTNPATHKQTTVEIDDSDEDISRLIEGLSLSSAADMAPAPRRGSKMDMLRRRFSTSSATRSVVEPASGVGSPSRARGRSSVSLGDQNIIISGLSDDEEPDSGSDPSSSSSSSETKAGKTARRKSSEDDSTSESSSSVPEEEGVVADVRSAAASSIAEDVTGTSSSVPEVITSVTEETSKEESSSVIVTEKTDSSSSTTSSNTVVADNSNESSSGGTKPTTTAESKTASRRKSRTSSTTSSDSSSANNITQTEDTKSDFDGKKSPAYGREAETSDDTETDVAHTSNSTNTSSDRLHPESLSRTKSDAHLDEGSSSNQIENHVVEKPSPNHREESSRRKSRTKGSKTKEKAPAQKYYDNSKNNRKGFHHSPPRKQHNERIRHTSSDHQGAISKHHPRKNHDGGSMEHHRRDAVPLQRPPSNCAAHRPNHHDRQCDAHADRRRHSDGRMASRQRRYHGYDPDATWPGSEERTEASESLVVSYQRRVAFTSSKPCRHCTCSAHTAPPQRPHVTMVLPPAAGLTALTTSVAMPTDDDPVVAALLAQQIVLTRHFLAVQRRTHATYTRLLDAQRHRYTDRADLRRAHTRGGRTAEAERSRTSSREHSADLRSANHRRKHRDRRARRHSGEDDHCGGSRVRNRTTVT